MARSKVGTGKWMPRKVVKLVLTILLWMIMGRLNAQVDYPRISVAGTVMSLGQLLETIEAQTPYKFFRKRIESLLDKQIAISANNQPLNFFLDANLTARLGIHWDLDHTTIFLERPPGGRLDTLPAPDTTRPRIACLDTARVEYFTGYRHQSADEVTGSFSEVDSNLVRQTTSPYVLDHLENNSPGILFNHGGQSPDGTALPAQPVVRGESTILSNPAPILVVDNFPYDGDLRNINPDDISGITILKDAAAAAIWGVRAGNGVIVITTKKGRTPRPRVEFGTAVTFQGRPDLFNIRSISAADQVQVEKDRYDSGYYSGLIANHVLVSPVVQLLQQGDTALTSLKRNDIRRDMGKYFYRNSTSLQNYLSLSGSTPLLNYYYSVGWTHAPSALAASRYDRISFRGRNTFQLPHGWQIDAAMSFTEGIQTNGDDPGYAYTSLRGNKHFPAYGSLVDASGHSLPFAGDYDPSFLQQATQQGLPNWQYYPASDIGQENNTVRTHDYVLNTAVRRTILPFISLELRYQLEYQWMNREDAFSAHSYYARDLVNTYAQVDPTGQITYPIPPGGILDLANTQLNSQQGRAQLNINPSRDKDHRLAAILGYEIRSLMTTGNTIRYYGYDPDIAAVNDNVSYTTLYTTYQGNGPSTTIPALPGISRRTDHFISYYADVSYTHHQRYISSFSARLDEANLFGVNTNLKGVPLFSAGEAWWLSREPFYSSKAFPSLKLRLSYGYNGNIARQASAYTTAAYQAAAATTPLATATLLSPPNANLRWERVRILNGGVDFGTKGGRITGTLEAYWKSARDLMGEAPIDPTYGLVTNPAVPALFYGNTASMEGRGIDLQLDIRVLDTRGRHAFSWDMDILSSHAVSTVTQYGLPVTKGNQYLSQNIVNPVRGRPLYAVYSFAWQGLDPQTGDPLGWLKGAKTKNWSTIWDKTAVDSMVYNGPAEPAWYGAWRNTFRWRSVSLVTVISYKFSYYFRRPSINYSNLFQSWSGHSDFARRWQHPGDELKTAVPSLVYDLNENRDNFYTYSSVLVDRGDHIRLDHIRLSYDRMKPGGWTGRAFRELHAYIDADNLGILWRANKHGIDPYYINVPRDGRRYSIGMTVVL